MLIPMRDGVNIAVRVYRPDGDAKVPALFAASPYRYDNDQLPTTPIFLSRETGPIEWYVEHGYAYVHADVRGTGFSEGEYGFLGAIEPLAHHLAIKCEPDGCEVHVVLPVRFRVE